MSLIYILDIPLGLRFNRQPRDPIAAPLPAPPVARGASPRQGGGDLRPGSHAWGVRQQGANHGGLMWELYRVIWDYVGLCGNT